MSEVSSTREFAVIDGLRSILSFWVVSCHVISLTLYMVYAGSPQQPEKLEYMATSWWTFLALGLGYQVDVFFMISGFLTSWSFLHKKSHYSGSVARDLIALVVRRVLRLWPMVIIQMLVSYMSRDYNGDNFSLLLSCLTFPISAHLPIVFGVQWSTRVDIIGTLLLYAVFACMDKLGLKTLSISAVVAVISFIPNVWRFLDDDFRKYVSFLALRLSGNRGDGFMPLYMTLA